MPVKTRAVSDIRSIHAISTPLYTENSRRLKRGFVPAESLADLGRWLVALAPPSFARLHGVRSARPATRLRGSCLSLDFYQKGSFFV